jgi:hypothetical protein
VLRLHHARQRGVDLAAQRLVLGAQIEQRNLDALACQALPSFVPRAARTGRGGVAAGGLEPPTRGL